MSRSDRPTRLQAEAAALGGVLVLLISCLPCAAESSASETVSPDVVATVGVYEITRDELKERLTREIRPQREDDGLPPRSVTVPSVLGEMMAEKAMILEGRAGDYLADEAVSDSLQQIRRRQLTSMLLTDYVNEQVPVTDAQIEAQIEANPQLTRDQAMRQIQTPRAAPILQAFYAELLDKYKLEKVAENLAQASQIHQRLLTAPASSRGSNIFWITNVQVRDELTQAEKNLVLARYEGGQVTLEDWLKELCRQAPPGRPQDLNTPEGVEKFLDLVIQPFILVTEAKARGLDQNADFLQRMREIEDVRLLGLVQARKSEEITEPNDAEVRVYFDAHEERFGTPDALRIDQFWCKDRQSAEDVRRMLDDSASLEAVTSAFPDVQTDAARTAYAVTEGLFWDELWRAEPNDVVGPIRGFHNDGVRWRVVRVLEKTPRQAVPYSDNVRNRVRSAMYMLRRRQLLASYGAELLEKYPHRVYTERIADIDPLEVTAVEPGND